MAKRIKTVRELVRALGPTSEVADMLGISTSGVHMAAMRGRLDPGHFLTLYLRVGPEFAASVDPEIFRRGADGPKP
jgi:hypothetical protein